MIRTRRPSRKCVPSVSGLETRGLMATGFRSAFLSQGILSAIASRVPPIQGTIHGTVTQVIPLSANSEEVVYTAIAKANIIGDGRGFGSHVIISRPFRGGTTLDQYRNGSAAVKGTTDTVAINYNGIGITRPDGSFSANWRGRAMSVAGEH
ncbi:MAG TPA: hypothetical protein VFT74_13115, partial [Isosphaeraceae bacterium]|nr:hypothetical protein [Isosphaeraceae bacterium]